ncbi:MAG TPA: SIMPL domain-containing protein [Acidimicrobiales bacterium]|nr:SIMPL domain-containing protein [Acidimicrobiales bacterium]
MRDVGLGRVEPDDAEASIPGVEIQEGDAGGAGPPRQAATGRKWSARPHEQLIGMVVLSVALVIGSLSVDAGLRSRNQPPRSDQVTVTGSAEQAVTADTFQWDASVASAQPTTASALAQLNQWAAQIRAALDNAGAHDNEITFGSVTVQPNTDQSGDVTSFTESQTVTVQSTRLAAMRRVLSVSNQLLAKNVPFIAQGPEYVFSGLKRLRPVLTAQATADAKVRARAALGRNGHLGRLISISVGQFSVDAPGSVNIGSGDYDTGTIQQVVSVPVSATYSIS